MSETEEAPIRVCCGQRHYGPQCPDGLVMCCMCFKRVTVNRLHVLEEGDGSSPASAPIHVDVCVTCKKREDRWGDERGCDYHGTGPHRCPCRRTSEQVVAQVISRVTAPPGQPTPPTAEADTSAGGL